MLVHTSSLSKTVDATSAALFDNRKLSAAERTHVARWVAARQGLPGAYAETFAGFAAERKTGILLFTGERITSASARHILGEETCRVLRLLRVRDSSVQAALDRACDGIMGCLERAARDPRNDNPGRYCCGKCSVGLWRNLIAGGLDRREERLRRGVSHLRTERITGAQWRRFPFWYTVLALSEIDLPEASRELKYAAPNPRTYRQASASGDHLCASPPCARPPCSRASLDTLSAAQLRFGKVIRFSKHMLIILTHPEIPCVFWPHFFDYGTGYSSQPQNIQGPSAVIAKDAESPPP